MTGKSLLRALGLVPVSAPTPAESDTLGKIEEELSHLAPERARFIALFACLLGRVAYADFDVSSSELAKMRQILIERAKLERGEAELVIEIAVHQTRLFGSTQSFQIAREFKALSERAERLTLLECLFEVAAADGEISAHEEHELDRTARELGLDRQELTAVRAGFREHRSVLK